MRTAKALGRKAGFGLCSKFAIILYIIIIAMFYGIATLTISNQAAQRRISLCENRPRPIDVRSCAAFSRCTATVPCPHRAPCVWRRPFTVFS